NGLKREDPDFYAGLVLNDIMGSASLTSRLATEIREKRGLAYYANSTLDPMLHAGVWYASFATRDSQVQEAVKVARGTIAQVQHQGVSQEEVDTPKRFLPGPFPLNLDTNANVAAFLISMQLQALGRDYLDRRNTLVNAVTRDAVNKLAQKLFVPENL